MGFFKKLFRRGKGNGAVALQDNTTPAPKNQRARGRGRGGKPNQQAPQPHQVHARTAERESPTTQDSNEDPHMVLQVAPLNSNKLNSANKALNGSASAAAYSQQLHNKSTSRRGPDLSDGSQGLQAPVMNRRGQGPVDLDESDIDYGTSSEAETSPKGGLKPTLSARRLQEFNSLQQQTAPAATSSSKPIFSMDPEPVVTNKNLFSAGHVSVNDTESDGESSSFNLSTDAEDTEYEDLRRRGVVREGVVATKKDKASANNAAIIASSVLDTSIDSRDVYKSDGESVFPNLPTDDEGTTTTEEKQRNEPSALKHTVVTNGGKVRLLDGSSVRNKQGSTQTWTLGSLLGENQLKQADDAIFEAAFADEDDFANTAAVGSHSKSDFKNNKSSLDPFATTNVNDLDMNFANFNKMDWDTTTSTPKQDPPTVASPAVEKPSPPARRSISQRQMAKESTPLSELLAQAKSKSRNKTGSHSVNSAPALTASFLRQQHGLKPVSRDDTHTATTVTDIIKSLEESDHYSLRKSAPQRYSRGTSDANSHTSGRSAKERLRRRRETERRRSADNDSTDTEEKDSESWLMDEVTGALGPLGIAADLESLSGRSNRSRSSGGGRSHKSHRSHRSHRSSTNRHRHSHHRHHHGKASSGESVDSHGSRRSRGSRYSHRSTRSYISQMSEQSRSVANDLLRLEMQLAMVNPTTDGGGSASIRSGRRSTTSRPRVGGSSTAARRSRVTVTAPPGKLGIILANKADSRGTVVSGVRTSSVLADRISPGDRIVAIDGEDVSMMTVSEITTIMARKSEFERQLTVLTTRRTSAASGSSAPTNAEGIMTNPAPSSRYR